MAQLAVAYSGGIRERRGQDPICGVGQHRYICQILRSIAVTVAELRKCYVLVIGTVTRAFQNLGDGGFN
jgi:hypothetical protein